jgi:outer membrane protein assembly factor BamB
LDAATGQRHWHYHHPTVRLHLLDDRSVVLAVSPPGGSPPNAEHQLHLATLDAATGAEHSACDIPPGGFSFLATQGMTLYGLYARHRRSGESSTLVAYSLVGGHLLWSMTTGHANPDGQRYHSHYRYAWQGVIMDDRLYIHELLEPDKTIEVQAYDLKSRTPAWTWQSPAGLWHDHLDPALCGGNGHLYLTTNQGLFAVSATTGRLIWHTAMEQDFSGMVPIFIG